MLVSFAPPVAFTNMKQTEQNDYNPHPHSEQLLLSLLLFLSAVGVELWDKKEA